MATWSRFFIYTFQSEKVEPARYCRIVLLRKKPPFRRKTAQGLKLSVFYFRIVKATTPTKVRTALNSSEKSTVRLKFNSQLRHNCPNTRRKQASDGVKLFIASLLCCATAPNSRLEPFFLYTPFSRRRLKGPEASNEATQQRRRSIVQKLSSAVGVLFRRQLDFFVSPL